MDFFQDQKFSSKTLKTGLTLISKNENKDIVIIPCGIITRFARSLLRHSLINEIECENKKIRLALEIYNHGTCDIRAPETDIGIKGSIQKATHLDFLEAEAIYIMREVVAEAINPVMLYSIGKDSSVMLHLAKKAFYPSSPPFPLLHVDTRWKFKAMYDFRDYTANTSGMELKVHINSEGVEKNINPIDHGSVLHTDVMKTQSLKQALDFLNLMSHLAVLEEMKKSRVPKKKFSLFVINRIGGIQKINALSFGTSTIQEKTSMKA